ncbi:hypothetical protein [Sporosarcina sp. 6E9]|uniref:hypothetical protein n=1 Tax=Sporosarcina sp. 6E9 TaxID=2819235 RepID=UPI001FF0A2FE|nr:hypothetical protein [Sporosarcina sp. 6E9]
MGAENKRETYNLKGFVVTQVNGGDKVIHTFKLFFVLHHEEVSDLQRRLNINYEQLNQHFDGRLPGVSMSLIYCKDGKWRLYMVIDAIKLLGKPDIIDADYVTIERELKYILYEVVGHTAHYKDHILHRIDYRYDVKIADENKRMLLMHLYKKLTKSYRFQKRYLGKIVDDVYVPYKTTVYHSSKSITSMVYLKEEERKENGEKVEDYEKDVIRFEVSVRRDHLYYMANKNDKFPRPRQLGAYMQRDVYREYFRKYMLQIYHVGDYHKIDAARDVLKNSSLSMNNKIKLIDFLKNISAHTIDTPLKKMSPGTYKSRMALLKQENINPIPIPKNYPKAPDVLRNPLNDFPW